MTPRYLRKLNRIVLSTCFLGILASIYMLNIERKIEANENYKAMCDLSEHVNCTKMFKSKHSKGLGIVNEGSPLYLPNSAFAILYYSFLGFLSMSNSLCIARLQVFVAFMSILASAFLVHILISVLKDFCIVCALTYLFNGICFWYSYKKYKIVKLLHCSAITISCDSFDCE